MAKKSQSQSQEPELLNLKQAAAYAQLSDQRLRNLLSVGRIPAAKTEKGYWRVDPADIDAYHATKGTRQASGGRKQWTIAVNAVELEALEAWINTQGYEDVVIKPRYNYNPEKAKAYREARKAQLAAEAEAEGATD